MIDYGTRQTDLAVKRAEWRLSRVYRQAQRDIDKKLKDWQKRNEEREAKYRQQLADGKISQADFDAWMRGQVFQDKQWQARKAEIDRILLNADREAQRIVNEGKIGVFADNANYIGYDLERNGNVNTGFTLYDQNTVGRLIKSDPQILPKPAPGVQKDKAYTYYNKLMNSAITQGIVQGETIPQIAKRIVDVTGERSYSSAVRNARTAYTGAQNAGRMEGLHQAQALGIKVKKQWMATLDDRTRDTHAELDGQIRDVDEPFESELGDIMYPGDPTAEPGNVYNCFVGETNIATDSEIIRSYKHDYSGKLITVKTSSGVEFTCTPNHPILTPSGWVAAERLQDRNNLLIANIGEDDPLRINPYIEHAFTRIDAIHQLFDEMGSKRTARLGVNFHGDVPTTDVEIITQKRFLRNNRDSGCADGVNKLLLKHSDESLMGKGAFVQHFGSVWFAALRFVCGFGKALSFFWQSLTHAVIHRFGTVARSNTTVFEPQADSMTGNVQFLGEGLDGFSCKVFIDNIVNINITTVSHIPVYNLQTGNSRYFVNSIITQNKAKCNGKFAIAHNCRCTLVYVYPDYPSEMQRRDNETGEIVGDMTYREWEEMKRGEEESPEEPQKDDTNIYGRHIEIDDRLTGDVRETLETLIDEYDTRLEKVELGHAAGVLAAGSVDMSGAGMKISAREPTVAIHEFAHTLANSKADKYRLTHDGDFWKEIKKIRRDYKKDVDKEYNFRRFISGYEHSATGAEAIDEFFAEAFTQAKAREMGIPLPDKYGEDFTYSQRVLDVVDRYFRRGHHGNR